MRFFLCRDGLLGRPVFCGDRRGVGVACFVVQLLVRVEQPERHVGSCQFGLLRYGYLVAGVVVFELVWLDVVCCLCCVGFCCYLFEFLFVGLGYCGDFCCWNRYDFFYFVVDDWCWCL